MIDSKKFERLIKAYLDFYEMSDVELVYVAQVPGSHSPYLAASTSPDPSTGRQKIYLAQPMTDEIIDGGKSSCTPSIAQALISDDLFLKHTVLHEIRHIQHKHDCRGNADCELDCDTWAYEQLKLKGEL